MNRLNYCVWIASVFAALQSSPPSLRAVEYRATLLHPADKYESTEGFYGSKGNQVVRGTVNRRTQALLWSGNAENVVSLHPAAYSHSWAWSAYDSFQVGYGRVPSNGQNHALLWNGSSQSVVDLHPPGFDASSARGGHEGHQV